MWWTDESCSDDGRVGAAAVFKHGDQWKSRCSFLGTKRMKVFDPEPWATGPGLDIMTEKRETLQSHRVMTVVI